MAVFSFSTASIVRIYREQIFPKLAINGWALKEKASEVDDLKKAVDELKNALTHVESENSAYKTRVDALQETVNEVIWDFRRMEALHSVQMGKLFEKGYLDMPLDKFVKSEEVEKYLKEKYGDNR